MCVVTSSWLLVCLGRVGLGRPGWGVSHGGLGGRPSCTGVRGGWFVWCWHRRRACCWWAAAVLWLWWSGWWWVSLRVCVGVACCRGSGVVRPGCLACLGLPCLGVLGGCGWVGCELYSGREHLTVRFLRQSVSCFVRVSCVVCCFERSVDALASGADEGRGGLRYSSGSRLAGCDPRVSEWGDPARVMSCHLHLNCIGCGG